MSNQTNPMKTQNTYSLLVNSEEKSRGIFESIVYGLVFASMAFAAIAFASQSVTVPRMPKASAAPVEIATATPVAKPVVQSRG